MEQSPSWEADSHSASQDISRLLWNPKAYYHVQRGGGGVIKGIKQKVKFTLYLNKNHDMKAYTALNQS
jgi:hypothetical protein